MLSYTLIDKAIINFDLALQTLLVPEKRPSTRASPGDELTEPSLSTKEKRLVAGLMRVNHSGEVCAQALYQGQSLTANLKDTREKMKQAALEEVDHLAWCEKRLGELKEHPSLLNPMWYTLSLAIGSTAGLIGDKWSLGFVVETERQVTKHLDSHLKQLPKVDIRSKAILKQMKIDETIHATTALQAGGAELPETVKTLMGLVSKLMTKTSYFI